MGKLVNINVPARLRKIMLVVSVFSLVLGTVQLPTWLGSNIANAAPLGPLGPISAASSHATGDAPGSGYAAAAAPARY